MTRPDFRHLLLLVLAMCLSGCVELARNEPLVDARRDADGSLILLDTPRMWADWVSGVDRAVAMEVAGQPPGGGIASWEEQWPRVIRANSDRGNAARYIDYIIQARRRAGLHELASLFPVGSWLGVPDGTWQAEEPQVAEAGAALRSYVEAQARQAGQTLPPWASYSFQYQGTLVEGRKLLKVNAFCEAPPPDAATRMVVVFDGGPCYFQAYWDPESKTYVGMAFNGFA